MDEYENEKELMDYLNVIWKRKWLIIIPTFFIVIIAGISSFLLPKVWEIDAIIQPSKFFVPTESGQYEEVVVLDPKQIAGQINQTSYNSLIAAELNLDLRNFPRMSAENLRDTKLVRVAVREKDIEKAKLILISLFNHLKGELDQKIEVEIKGVDTQISDNENLIKLKELIIKDNLNEIKLKQIEKNKIREGIISAENKHKISEERVQAILDEMKSVKGRIDELEKQQRNALAENKENTNAIRLLLYSNEVQQNLRYYNTLDEKLSAEKITQENLSLFIKEKNEEIKQSDTQIEKLHIEIDKIKNEIENVKSQIKLLKQKKSRIDYAQLIKEPTSSLYPVSPKKRQNVLLAGVLGLMIFTILAFFIEYIKDQRKV